MTISVFKTFSAGEVLTASDLNSSLTQITDNGEDLGWPATKAKDLDGNELILDSDGDTSITADTDDQVDFKLAGTDTVSLAVALATFNTDLLVTESNDGADTGLTIRNSAGSGSTDETVSLLFQHVDANGPGGKILSGRKSDYSSGANEDSFMDFYIAVNGNDAQVFKLSHNEMRFTFAADGADTALTVRNSAGSGSTDETVTLKFQHVDANGPGGRIVSGREQDYSSGANEDGFISFYTPLNGTDTRYMHITSAGLATIGDTTAVTNTNMNQGLTLRQGAFDTEIQAWKSSDVDHPMTDLAETDTFGTVAKIVAASGGLNIAGYSDADVGMKIIGNGSTETTDNDTTSDAAVILVGQLSTSATVGALGATGNVFAVKNGATTLFLLEGDGDMHVTNRSAGAGDVVAAALDDEDDVGLVRAFERSSHNIGIIMSKWDDQVQVNEEDLRRVGVLSPGSHFYNVQRMNSLLGGAIWQTHTRQCAAEEREMYLMQLLEEDTPGITARMQAKLADAKMPRLPL